MVAVGDNADDKVNTMAKAPKQEKVQEEAKGEGEGEAGGSGKKKLIIIIAAVLLVLLIGGGAAAYFLFLKPADPAAAEGEAHGEVAKDAKGKEKGHEKEQHAEGDAKKAPPIYFPLDPPLIVNLPGKPGMLQVTLVFLVRSEELKEFIKVNNPMVRHRLLNILGAQDGTALKARPAKDKLRADLFDEILTMLKELESPGKPEAIYFSTFVLQ